MSNVTTHATVTWMNWKGHAVMLTDSDNPNCAHGEIQVMHHENDPLDLGRHWCPTGFLWCPVCGAIGDEPPPHECTRWGA